MDTDNIEMWHKAKRFESVTVAIIRSLIFGASGLITLYTIYGFLFLLAEK